MRDGAARVFGGVDTGGELLHYTRIRRHTQKSCQWHKRVSVRKFYRSGESISESEYLAIVTAE